LEKNQWKEISKEISKEMCKEGIHINTVNKLIAPSMEIVHVFKKIKK